MGPQVHLHMAECILVGHGWANADGKDIHFLRRGIVVSRPKVGGYGHVAQQAACRQRGESYCAHCSNQNPSYENRFIAASSCRGDASIRNRALCGMEIFQTPRPLRKALNEGSSGSVEAGYM